MALIPKDADPDDPTPITQIAIIVAEIRHDKVRLGIEADSCIPCHREEIWNQIKMGNGKKNEKASLPLVAKDEGETPDLDMGVEWIEI